MTTSDKLAAIREACVEANPDIRPWSVPKNALEVENCGYGCGRIWNEKGGANGFDNCVSAYHVPPRCKQCVGVHDIIMSGCTGFICTQSCACVRPIRLADVLLAISHLWVQPKTGKKDDYRYINNAVFSTGIKWNLRNDSLDWHAEHQPETIDFLYDVFKQK